MLLIFCLLLVTHTVCGQHVTVVVGDTSVIPCRISETFILPQWKGPPNDDIYTLQNKPQFNQRLANFARLSYNTDQRSINIANTATSDSGEFVCTKLINGRLFDANVTLEVRVSPSAPTFNTNIGQISNRQLIVTEDQQVTLICTSRGGNPVSTVKLYQTSVSGSPVAQISTGTQEADGTLTVTLNYQFTAVRSLDRLNYICTSAFTTAPLAQQTATIQFFFNLKPSTPSIFLVGTPVSGQSSQTIARCTTSGFRPAAGISITMTFRGVIRTYNTVVGPSSTDTHSVTGEYSKAVDKRDNGKTLTCSVSHSSTLTLPRSRTSTISVQFAPNSATLILQPNVVADGTSKVLATCTSGSSNPAAAVTWRVDGATVTSSITSTTGNGVNNGQVTTQQLQIVATRNMHDKSIVCYVSNTVNIQTPVASTQNILNLKFHPIAVVTGPLSPVTESQPSGTLKCTVSSNPISTSITWYHGNTTIPSNSVTVTGNVATYTIPSVDRTDAGIYKCTAVNGYTSAGEGTTSLGILYAPDVTVTTTNTTESAPSIDVVCRPSGVPATYDITQWTQTWTDETVINTNLPLQQTLTLTDLSYQHSGIYTCKASNGITYSNKPNAGVGSAYLLVKSSPVLTEPVIEENKNYKASAQLGIPFSVVIKYYSNAANDNVDLCTGKGGTRKKLDVASISIADTTVQLPVFQQTVQATGRQANITLTITQKEHFQNYSIDVYNDIGHHIFMLEINPEGPPEKPDKLALGDPTETSIPVFWRRGFHGGADQTFVIQVSSNEQDWRNVSNVDVYQEVGNDVLNVTITDLSSGTLYYIRLFSFNRFGQSHGFTKHLSFTTKEGTQQTMTESSIPTAGIIGGITGAVIVIALVAIAICMARKYNIKIICEKKQGEEPQNALREYENVTTQGERQQHVSEQVSYNNTGRESEPDPSTYESLSDREPTPNMYSALQNIEMDPTRNTASNHPAVSEPIQSQYESLTDREVDPNMYSSLDNTESNQDGKDALNPEQVYINLKV